MAIKDAWSYLVGTQAGKFFLGLSGVLLKNSSGDLTVRNHADSDYAEVTAKKLTVDGADVVLDNGDDPLTLSNNSAQSGALQIIMPPAKATDGQVLRQKAGTGSGVIELEFASAGDTSSAVKDDTTALAFGDTSPVAMFTTGAADVIRWITVHVDTAFNGTAPTLSIGISGTTSKYMATTDVDLKTTGSYTVYPGQTAQGAEALIATYSADSSSAGAARIEVHYDTPS